LSGEKREGREEIGFSWHGGVGVDEAKGKEGECTA